MSNADLMDTAEVAEYLRGRVKVATLRWWRYEGKGRGPKSFTLGGGDGRRGRVCYRKVDVDEWLEAQYNAGDQASA